MSNYTPISGAPIQYQKSDGTLASGYFLKFYSAGTTSPLSMATNATGSTTLAKCQINSSGYPINGSNEVFIPHISKDYKIALYKNATDADNDTTANADWVVDPNKQIQTGNTDLWSLFSATPTQTSSNTFTLAGDQRSTFVEGLRLKFTDSSTLYGVVSSSAYTTLTTVTAVLDSGSLSGSLSAVYTSQSTPTQNPVGAKSVSYLAEGTGAVPTNVQDKLRELVSVTDFGVVGDGVTDDSPEIQEAINFFEDSSGQIYFPPGTYIIDETILVLGKIHLVGAGRDVTIFKLKDSAKLSNNNGIMFDTFYRDDITFSHMTFDGNISNQSDYVPASDNGVSAILCRDSKDIVIENCSFRNIGKDGVWIFDVTDVNERIKVINCEFENIYRFGVSVVAGKEISVLNCRFQGGSGLSDNAVVANGGVTYEADSSPELLNGLTISGCQFYDMKSGVRITNLVGVTDIDEILITNNEFKRITLYAACALYDLGDAAPNVSNNIFYDCGSTISAAGVYEFGGAIGINGTQGSNITGNTFVRCGGTRATIYGDSGTYQGVISNNIFIDDRRAGLFIQNPTGAGSLGGTFRTITGNVFLNGSQDAANTYAAIRLSNFDSATAESGGDIIDGNIIQTSSTTGYSHGIRLFLDDGSTIVGTNKIVGTGIDILIDASSDKPIRDFDTYDAPSTDCTGALTNSVTYKVRKFRDTVNIQIDSFSGTTTNVADITLGQALPERFRPNSKVVLPVVSIVNNTQQIGKVEVTTAGVIELYRDPAQTTWGTLGGTGVQRIDVSYTI